jgi:DNA-binding NarL/FixJ family response regulator
MLALGQAAMIKWLAQIDHKAHTMPIKLYPVKVFIVGDNHITRSGLRRILELQATIRVVGEIGIKQLTTDTIFRHDADIVLIDLDPRGADLLTFIGAMHDASHDIALLILSDLSDHELARRALAIGAHGIVLKIQPPAVLLAAIADLCHLPHSGTAFHSTDTRRIKPNKSWKGDAFSAESILKIDRLTSREREIIHLIGSGLKNKDIAVRLSISDITVRHHLTSIFRKLEVSDRQKLLILAYRFGLAELASSAEPA